MVELQEKIIKYIVPNITESVVALFNYNYNGPYSFHTWLECSSDSDFAYIYVMEFKRHFLIYFTLDTERILSYYSQNFAYSIWAYYELERDSTKIIAFIKKLILIQLKNLDFHQLFMEN